MLSIIVFQSLVGQLAHLITDISKEVLVALTLCVEFIFVPKNHSCYAIMSDPELSTELAEIYCYAYLEVYAQCTPGYFHFLVKLNKQNGNISFRILL